MKGPPLVGLVLGSLHICLPAGAKGFFLCLDGLYLGSSEVTGYPGAAFGGGVCQDRLIQGFALVDHLIAEVLPTCPGVGFLGDASGGLGCVVSLGIGPCHPESHGEGLDALAEDPPRCVHDAAEIVLFHSVTSCNVVAVSPCCRGSFVFS